MHIKALHLNSRFASVTEFKIIATCRSSDLFHPISLENYKNYIKCCVIQPKLTNDVNRNQLASSCKQIPIWKCDFLDLGTIYSLAVPPNIALPFLHSQANSCIRRFVRPQVYSLIQLHTHLPKLIHNHSRILHQFYCSMYITLPFEYAPLF